VVHFDANKKSKRYIWQYAFILYIGVANHLFHIHFHNMHSMEEIEYSPLSVDEIWITKYSVQPYN
jgi:hypothetical protein